jgi:hypothetical protein
MAKQLQSVSLGAAGFLGVNSMDPPLQQSLDYAETANHAVIDKFGRLGARKGFNLQTTTTDAGFDESTDTIEVIGEWSRPGNDPVLICAGNNNIFYITTDSAANDTLTSFTYPGGYTITGDKWQFLDFNQELIMIQEGHAPLTLNETNWGTKALTTTESESAESVPDVPVASCATAAYGRLWFGAPTGEPQMVYWSDTLIADGWTEGFSGSLNLATVWPNGYDEVVGIAAHNERLIIFGRNSFVVYSGATDPTNMELEDAIAGVGCVWRDSIVHTGEDIVFLSYTGVKSLARTVLQNQLPSGDLTANIRNKLIADIVQETENAIAGYSQEETMYVITFKTSGTTYYLDYKSTLEEGRKKCTVWPGTPFQAWYRGDDGVLYTGGLGGFGTYAGFQDAGASYRFQYYGPALTFGDASRIKIVKKLISTIVGGVGRSMTVFWGYGYGSSYESEVFTIPAGSVAEFGIAEYNTAAEYSTGVATTDADTNTTGSGEVVRVGIGVDVNGGEFSLQQLRVHVIMGRIV